MLVIQGLIIVMLAGAAFWIDRPQGERAMSDEMAGRLHRLDACASAMPLLLAATGELVSEKAGVLNMSVEGMMLTGAFAGAIGSWATGSPMLGLAIGLLAVMPVALLQAFLSITLRANQIVTGIGINILVLGAHHDRLPRDPRPPQPHAQIPGLDKWSPPGLGDIPVFGEAIFRQTWLLYAGARRSSRSSPGCCATPRSAWPCAPPAPSRARSTSRASR